MNPFEDNKDLLEQFCPGYSLRGQETYRPVFPDLMDHIVNDIYGFAYRRTELDIKTRHLVTLGILTAMGGCEGQLNFQLRAGLNLGLTEIEIKEVFIQAAVLAGNARAANAARVFDAVLHEAKSPSKT